MRRKQLFLLTLACTWALAASAQWQWIDKDGRKVFSDRPPPQDVPEKNVLRQPTLRATMPNPMPPAQMPAPGPAAQTPASTASVPQPAVAAGDRQLQERKAKAEAADAARRQAEEKTQAERQAKARADNCARARQASSALSSGAPMAYTNASGERGFMDEATRAAELRRVQDLLASGCQ